LIFAETGCRFDLYLPRRSITLETILFLSGATGGGIAATLIFKLLRHLNPQPQADASTTTSGWRTIIEWLLWAPLGARVSVMGMSILIVVAFTAAREAFAGGDILAQSLAAFDIAVGASGVSQIIHAPSLSRQVSVTYDDLSAHSNEG
jgi:hypothetical protein